MSAPVPPPGGPYSTPDQPSPAPASYPGAPGPAPAMQSPQPSQPPQSPQPAQWAPPPGGPAPAPAPRNPALRRRLIWIGSAVGAVLILLVAAAVVISQINSRSHSPQARALDFLSALERGSATEALEIASFELSASERAALTDEIYAEAQSRPTEGRVLGSTVSGSYATIEVEYVQGDRTVTETLTAERRGKTGVFFDVWRITAWSTGQLSMVENYNATAVELNGVEVDLPGTGTLAVFPGEYTVALPDSALLETSTETVMVYGTDRASVPALTLTPTEAFTTAANGAIQDHLDQCLASTELEPDNCPNRSWALRAVDNVSWTLDTPPTVTIDQSSYDPTSFSVTARSGSATASGTYAEDWYAGSVGDPFSEQSSISFSGSLSIDGDSVVFQYGY